MRFGWPLLFACVLFWAEQLAAGASATNRNRSHHYLLVIDTSFSMSRQKKPVTDAVRNLIASGINGHMRAGDTLVIWTFNDQVRTDGRPKQVWSPERASALAGQASRFLQNHRFEKAARLDRAMTQILRTVRSAEALTVLILSDGDPPLQGTPFDREINALYDLHGRQLRRTKRPLVTVLSARGGELLAWSVGIGDGPIAVPAFPPEVEMAAAAPVPPPILEATKPTRAADNALSPVVPRPADELPPAPERRSVVGEDAPELGPPPSRPLTHSPATPESPEPMPSAARFPNIEPAAAPVADAVPAPAPVIEARAPTLGTAAAIPHSDVGNSAPPPAQTAAIGLTEPRVTVERTSLRQPSTGSDPPATQAVAGLIEAVAGSDVAGPADAALAEIETTAGSLRLLFTGAALFFIAVGSLYWHIRSQRSPSQPSLISRSLNREEEK